MGIDRRTIWQSKGGQEGGQSCWQVVYLSVGGHSNAITLVRPFIYFLPTTETSMQYEKRFGLHLRLISLL